MKKLLLISLIGFTTLAIAQPQRPHGPSPERLIEELRLSQNQSQQVMNILREQHQKRRSLHRQAHSRNNGGDRSAMHSQMDSLRQETLKRLSSVLNQSQLQQFAELTERRHRGRAGRNNNNWQRAERQGRQNRDERQANARQRPQQGQDNRRRGTQSGQAPIQLASAAPTLSDSRTQSRRASNLSHQDGLPKFYEHFSNSVEVYVDGNNIVLSTNNIPNHPSPYFQQNDRRYEAPHAAMVVNPNRITEQNYTLRVPLNPQQANRATDTNLDAIGVAVNGVVMFNQYAGRSRTGGFLPLDREIRTFDKYNGHPARRGNYHYHIEPMYLTANDKTALVGVALDGFPIYGPLNPNGRKPSGLDSCNGEFGPTPDHPEGIYHYHITSVEPYIVGCYKRPTWICYELGLVTERRSKYLSPLSKKRF